MKFIFLYLQAKTIKLFFQYLRLKGGELTFFIKVFRHFLDMFIKVLLYAHVLHSMFYENNYFL